MRASDTLRSIVVYTGVNLSAAVIMMIHPALSYHNKLYFHVDGNVQIIVVSFEPTGSSEHHGYGLNILFCFESPLSQIHRCLERRTYSFVVNKYTFISPYQMIIHTPLLVVILIHIYVRACEVLLPPTFRLVPHTGGVLITSHHGRTPRPFSILHPISWQRRGTNKVQ